MQHQRVVLMGMVYDLCLCYDGLRAAILPLYVLILAHLDEVVIARRFHPFPSRTRPLSFSAPMVLLTRESRLPPHLFFISPKPEAFRFGLFLCPELTFNLSFFGIIFWRYRL